MQVDSAAGAVIMSVAMSRLAQQSAQAKLCEISLSRPFSTDQPRREAYVRGRAHMANAQGLVMPLELQGLLAAGIRAVLQENSYGPAPLSKDSSCHAGA